jgi:hypothetical protein
VLVRTASGQNRIVHGGTDQAHTEGEGVPCCRRQAPLTTHYHTTHHSITSHEESEDVAPHHECTSVRPTHHQHAHVPLPLLARGLMWCVASWWCGAAK